MLKQKRYLLLMPLFLAIGFSETEMDNTRPYWVYFQDKGMTESEIKTGLLQAYTDFDPKAIERRSKVRRHQLIDHRDLPVFKEFIDAVLLKGGTLRVKSRWLNAISVNATKNQINLITNLPFVVKTEPVRGGRRIEPDPVVVTGEAISQPLVQTRNDYGPSLYQLEEINVIPAHEAGFTGQGIRVLMLDTGYYKDHESIPNDQIVGEWDFINDDGETQNEEGDQDNQDGHGTATLTALGGRMDGQIYGPAYDAEFLLAKTEDRSQEVPIEEDWWVAGLEWGELQGADVASSSLGYIDWYESEDLDGMTAVTTIAADIAIDNGMIIANSAGNRGGNGIVAPADAFGILACGAVDSTGQIASFSSRGPTADGRIKPEVCARGVSTYCASASRDGTDIYRYASGTSLSAPLIGGACAVILSANPDWTPQQVRYALMSTANNAENPDNSYGWGIIDVMQALQMSFLAGDVDGNEIVNVLDIVMTVNFVLLVEMPTEYQLIQADVNADGDLDVLDIVQIVNIILSGPDD